jgi:hypothetical protein
LILSMFMVDLTPHMLIMMPFVNVILAMHLSHLRLARTPLHCCTSFRKHVMTLYIVGLARLAVMTVLICQCGMLQLLKVCPRES